MAIFTFHGVIITDADETQNVCVVSAPEFYAEIASVCLRTFAIDGGTITVYINFVVIKFVSCGRPKHVMQHALIDGDILLG
jgi:hypothetical protein